MIGVLAIFAFIMAWRRSGGSVQKEAQIASNRPVNPEAKDLYLKGRYYWNKRTGEGLTKAIDYFTQAIVRDPGYAQAYAGLADSYNLMREYTAMPPNEAYPRAIAAARKALELDDTSPEAHAALAFASFWWAWDFPTADREFRRALALNPNYVAAHHWYATSLVQLGRFQEALKQIERARELDPTSTAVLTDKALILFYAGQQDAAVALLKQVETIEPSFVSTHRYLSYIYFFRKEYPKYFAEARKTAKLSHDETALAITTAAEGFARGGQRAMLKSMLEVQKRFFAQDVIEAYSLASTCSLLKQKSDAFAYLRIAFQRHEAAMLSLRMDPTLANLRGDREYKELLKKVGFAPLS